MPWPDRFLSRCKEQFLATVSLEQGQLKGFVLQLIQREINL